MLFLAFFPPSTNCWCSDLMVLVADLWLLGVFVLFQPLGAVGLWGASWNPRITQGKSGVKAKLGLGSTTKATAAAGGAEHFGSGLVIWNLSWIFWAGLSHGEALGWCLICFIKCGQVLLSLMRIEPEAKGWGGKSSLPLQNDNKHIAKFSQLCHPAQLSLGFYLHIPTLPC